MLYLKKFMINVEERFRPGDRLPNETDFSAELNVSRTTFREAVRMLVDRGVLVIKRGNGTFVNENYQLRDDLGISEYAKKGVKERELNERNWSSQYPKVGNLDKSQARPVNLDKEASFALLSGVPGSLVLSGVPGSLVLSGVPGSLILSAAPG